MRTDIHLWQAAASLILVALVIVVSLWRQLGLERSIAWATVRATVQLLCVGVIFSFIFDSSLAALWSGMWVTLMVLVAGFVVTRRTGGVPQLAMIGLLTIGATVGVVLGVIFGLRVMDTDPIAVLVIAGITIGNTMPSVVQSVDRTRTQLREQSGQIEAMLSLGFDGATATREVVRDVCKLALIPQIERTKVVGLIALPGAMTGLLLAGVDPVDAVLIQLVVMFLVLGSVAVSVIIVTMALARKALTEDLRLADWVGQQASA